MRFEQWRLYYMDSETSDLMLAGHLGRSAAIMLDAVAGEERRVRLAYAPEQWRPGIESTLRKSGWTLDKQANIVLIIDPEDLSNETLNRDDARVVLSLGPGDAPNENHKPVRQWTAKKAVRNSDWVRDLLAKQPRFVRLLAAPVWKILEPAMGGRMVTKKWPDQKWRLYLESHETQTVSRIGDSLRYLLVTVGGVGAIRWFPGTWGAAVGMSGAWIFSMYVSGYAAFLAFSAAVVFATTLLSVWTEPWVFRRLCTKDPREVVLDEVAGVFLTYVFLPPWLFNGGNISWPWLVAGFFWFRVFDIGKWGVHWVEEKNWPGTIVWDDLIAGVYAGLVTLATAWFTR